MAKENEKVERQYPCPLGRVYVNVATAGLAILMVSVLVDEPFPLLSFVASASLLTVFRFFAKVRYVFKMAKLSKLQLGDVPKPLIERSWSARLLGLVAIAGRCLFSFS